MKLFQATKTYRYGKQLLVAIDQFVPVIAHTI